MLIPYGVVIEGCFEANNERLSSMNFMIKSMIQHPNLTLTYHVNDDITNPYLTFKSVKFIDDLKFCLQY